MQTKYLVFDKDGTIIDFEKFWLKILYVSVENILKKYSAPLSLAEKIYIAYGVNGSFVDINGIFCSGTYEMMSNAIFDIFSKNGIKADKDALFKTCKEEFHANYSYGEIAPACENIKELFEKISKNNIKSVLVTSDDEFGAKRCLEELGIIKYFDKIYFDDGINPPKPDPYYINLLRFETGAAPSEIVMAGDTLTDMRFAKNSGVCGIGIAKDMRNKEILAKVADAVIEDISRIFDVIK